MNSNKSWFFIILEIIGTIFLKFKKDKEKEKIDQALAEKEALEQKQKENEKINANLNDQYNKNNEEVNKINDNSSITEIKDKLNEVFK